jgi:hypothetical protein
MWEFLGYETKNNLPLMLKLISLLIFMFMMWVIHLKFELQMIRIGRKLASKKLTKNENLNKKFSR